MKTTTTTTTTSTTAAMANTKSSEIILISELIQTALYEQPEAFWDTLPESGRIKAFDDGFTILEILIKSYGHDLVAIRKNYEGPIWAPSNYTIREVGRYYGLPQNEIDQAVYLKNKKYGTI